MERIGGRALLIDISLNGIAQDLSLWLLHPSR
jgi:hypothetical protein